MIKTACLICQTTGPVEHSGKREYVIRGAVIALKAWFVRNA
jgi:hypothetical protein